MTNPPKKLIKSVQVDTHDPYEFEGTLKNVQQFIEGLIAQHGPDAELDWNPDHWEHYDNETIPRLRFEVTVQRDETDEEFNKRVSAETAQKEAQDARDKAEFERLKQKFGETNV